MNEVMVNSLFTELGSIMKEAGVFASMGKKVHKAGKKLKKDLGKVLEEPKPARTDIFGRPSKKRMDVIPTKGGGTKEWK